jgi:hypothetical protein
MGGEHRSGAFQRGGHAPVCAANPAWSSPPERGTVPRCAVPEYNSPQRVPERPMKDKQFEKLMKKTMEKAAKPKAKDRPTYDPTLEATRRPEAGGQNQADTEEFFSEMKRREF